MTSFDPAQHNSRAWDGIRWILVLPAALLSGFVVRLAAAMLLRTSAAAPAAASAMATSVRSLLVYVLGSAVLVVAGGLTAPRKRVLVATVLAGLFLVLSALRHLIVQYAAGNRVGSANFTHFGLEALGLLAGAACIVIVDRRRHRRQ